MTESHPDTAGAPGAASGVESGNDLELLAIEEHFAEAFHSGANPRLSDYLRRYPAYAEQLTDFASAFLPEAALAAEDIGGASQGSARLELSPGARRALDIVLAGPDMRATAEETLLVAEARAGYTTQPTDAETPGQAHSLPLAVLAEKTGLSPEVLVELAHTAVHAPETLSPVVVRRIAEALEASDDEAIRILVSSF